MRFDVVTGKDFADRALGDVGHARMSCGFGVLARMARQQPRRPKLVRISQILGLLAGQRDQPRLGVSGDLRRLARSRAVIERRHHAEADGAIKAPLDRLMGHAHGFAHRISRRVGPIGQQDPRPLDPTGRCRT